VFLSVFHWNENIAYNNRTAQPNKKIGNETQICISCLTVAAEEGCNSPAPTATFAIAYLKVLLSAQP
jgi:hypothetical protein